MKFTETTLPGVVLIEPEPHADERGFFARLFCEQQFAAQNLHGRFVQVNNSFNLHAATLRGLHYQLAPKQEVKLVRCVSGSVWDVVVDLRAESPTQGEYFATELSAENRRMLYVPQGCAHGFLTLAAGSEVLYLVSEFYSPQLERGIRWDDPSFSIPWPLDPRIISDRDRSHPDYHLHEQAALEGR